VEINSAEMQEGTDLESARALTGWQRAHVLAAAQYLGEIVLKSPADNRARSAHQGLLDVLEPTRRVSRQPVDRRAPAGRGSMWDRRSGEERRANDRRMTNAAPAAGGERRRVQRRSGRDRRVSQD
jgi:hypothetical protein